MDRITVILLCITTLCIFWIINKKEDTVDVSSYLEKIELLEKKVDSLHTKNTLLDLQADTLQIRIVEYDKKINELTRSITVIKKETNEKLNSVNILNDAELERFFAERYRQYKDSIN